MASLSIAHISLSLSLSFFVRLLRFASTFVNLDCRFSVSVLTYHIVSYHIDARPGRPRQEQRLDLRRVGAPPGDELLCPAATQGRQKARSLKEIMRDVRRCAPTSCRPPILRPKKHKCFLRNERACGTAVSPGKSYGLTG